MGPTKLLWLVVLGCLHVTRVAAVQEERLSYPCQAGASSHRIDLPPDAGEGEKEMQWEQGNKPIATYPLSGRHPSVLDVGEWGISLSSCMNLTLHVFYSTGKERRIRYTAIASPGNSRARSKGDGQRSNPNCAWGPHAGNSGGFGACFLVSLLTSYLLF